MSVRHHLAETIGGVGGSSDLSKIIHIRPMTLDDVAAVHAIDELSFSLPWPEKSFRYELTENPASMCRVAEWDDAGIVGMIVLWLIVDEAHIATIAVHPDYRGRGIARTLLADGLERMRALGAKTATLEVRTGNRAAQALYESFGFEVVGRRPRYYKDTGEDAVIMTLHRL
jgi:ribosomal-protein-alanine N-acetyltransferase